MTATEVARAIERVEGELESLANKRRSLDDERMNLQNQAADLYGESITNPARAADWKRAESRLAEIETEFVRVEQTIDSRKQMRVDFLRRGDEIAVAESEAEYRAATVAMEKPFEEIFRLLVKIKQTWPQVSDAHARKQAAEQRRDLAQHALGIPPNQRKRFECPEEAALVARCFGDGSNVLWDPRNLGSFESWTDFVRILMSQVKAGYVKL